MIPEEDMVITVSRGGYIKRSPLSIYRAQRRGGKGRTGMATKEEDVVEHLFVASTHGYVLAFTNRGRVHWIKVYDLPQIGPAARGKALVNLLQLEEGERPAAFLATKDFPEDRFVMFATKDGTVKKTALAAYSNVRAVGIIAINLEEGDELLSARITRRRPADLPRHPPGHGDPLPRDRRPPDGPRHDRASRGSSCKRNDDRVVEMDIVDETGEILTVTERGFGKRTDVAEYRFQGRGGSGVINVKIDDKNGPVAGIKCVTDGGPAAPHHRGGHPHPDQGRRDPGDRSLRHGGQADRPRGGRPGRRRGQARRAGRGRRGAADGRRGRRAADAAQLIRRTRS